MKWKIMEMIHTQLSPLNNEQNWEILQVRGTHSFIPRGRNKLLASHRANTPQSNITHSQVQDRCTGEKKDTKTKADDRREAEQTHGCITAAELNGLLFILKSIYGTSIEERSKGETRMR